MAMTAIEWNFAQLQAHLWQKCGAKKLLMGKPAVDRASELLITQWPYRMMGDDGIRARAVDDLQRGVMEQMQGYEGRNQRYGFIWMLLLSAVISQLIRLLLEWWLKSEDNQREMILMSQLKGGSNANR